MTVDPRAPHDGSRTFVPNVAAVSSVDALLEAFAARLSDLNRRNLLAGASADIQMQDPRDILGHAQALVDGMWIAGRCPPMDLVEALGAQVLALGLAVARVEDQRPELGAA